MGKEDFIIGKEQDSSAEEPVKLSKKELKAQKARERKEKARQFETDRHGTRIQDSHRSRSVEGEKVVTRRLPRRILRPR